VLLPPHRHEKTPENILKKKKNRKDVFLKNNAGNRILSGYEELQSAN